MQRQAVPLMQPESPIVGTGMEYVSGKDSGAAVICRYPGVVERVEAKNIWVRRYEDVDGQQVKGNLDKYSLLKFVRSNQGTCYNQRPIVSVGDEVVKGEILADGPSMEKGELALGRNVMVGFMTWDGYNYEDAIIMSERLVKMTSTLLFILKNMNQKLVIQSLDQKKLRVIFQTLGKMLYATLTSVESSVLVQK